MTKARILVVDDDLPLLEVLGEILTREGYDVTTAATWHEAEARATETLFDLFILDYKMPEVHGIDLMERLRRRTPTAEAMILTGHGTIEMGVEAIRRGARDFVTKPVERDEIRHRVETIVERRHLRKALRQKEAELLDRYGLAQIVGVSDAMDEVREAAIQSSSVMSNVLIEGESGTGKELVARAIHYSSARAEAPFVAVNCGAITPTLAERELFGHERGAYTGAGEQGIGYFEAASGGTLFLDEIGELPLDVQVKLLRALDTQEITRVGATQPTPVDVRMLFATNRDLEAMVEEQTFRHDLYYRLNVLRITIPSLRERTEDIPLLVTEFIRRSAERMKLPPKTITEEALAALEEHDWPGNARELQNVVERAMALSRGEQIELENLPGWVLQSREGEGSVPDGPVDFMAARRQAQERFDKEFILRALEQNDGNVSQTARQIGLARTALQRYMRKYNIGREDAMV